MDVLRCPTPKMQVIEIQALLVHLQESSQGLPTRNLSEQIRQALGLWTLLSLVFKNSCGI